MTRKTIRITSPDITIGAIHVGPGIGRVNINIDGDDAEIAFSGDVRVSGAHARRARAGRAPTQRVGLPVVIPAKVQAALWRWLWEEKLAYCDAQLRVRNQFGLQLRIIDIHHFFSAGVDRRARR